LGGVIWPIRGNVNHGCNQLIFSVGSKTISCCCFTQQLEKFFGLSNYFWKFWTRENCPVAPLVAGLMWM